MKLAYLLTALLIGSQLMAMYGLHLIMTVQLGHEGQAEQANLGARIMVAGVACMALFAALALWRLFQQMIPEQDNP